MIDIQNIINKTERFDILIETYFHSVNNSWHYPELCLIRPILVLHYGKTMSENKLIESFTNRRCISLHLDKKFLYKPNIVRFYVAHELESFFLNKFSNLDDLEVISLVKKLIPNSLGGIETEMVTECNASELCTIELSQFLWTLPYRDIKNEKLFHAEL